MADEPEDDVVKAISTLMSVLRPLDKEARVHVIEFVLKRLDISLAADATLQTQAPPFDKTLRTPSATEPSRVADIRSFALEKSPKTVSEKVALIAYYLAHLAPAHDRRDYLVSDDIRTYFIQAGFALPTAPASVTLANAKNAGYLNALDRGQFKLNAVGHNLISHKLPGDQTREKKRRRRKKSITNNKTRPQSPK
jgi:hypothetical protein